MFEHDLRANAFRVCREGKPLRTFPDHALGAPGEQRLEVGARPLRLGTRHLGGFTEAEIAVDQAGAFVMFHADAGRLGLSVLPAGRRLLLSVELEKRFRGTTVLHYGMELNFNNQYYLRSGFSYFPQADSRAFGSDVNFGAGLRLGPTDLDYSYSLKDKYSAEDLHRFTVVFRVGS